MGGQASEGQSPRWWKLRGCLSSARAKLSILKAWVGKAPERKPRRQPALPITKRMGLGPRVKACWRKAWVVKCQELHSSLGARFEEERLVDAPKRGKPKGAKTLEEKLPLGQTPRWKPQVR
jgi:hypothetical protein